MVRCVEPALARDDAGVAVIPYTAAAAPEAARAPIRTARCGLRMSLLHPFSGIRHFLIT
jgi:hypothetical protein